MTDQAEGAPHGYDQVIVDPQQAFAERLGLATGGRLVIRPDGYIGSVTDLGALGVNEYLALLAS